MDNYSRFSNNDIESQQRKRLLRFERRQDFRGSSNFVELESIQEEVVVNNLLDLSLENNSANMSGPDIRETLEGLPEDARNEIIRYLEQQRGLVNNRVVKVTNLNTCIDVPKYDSKKMTSDTYLKKCKNYFIAQGYEPEVFHTLVPMILKGDFKLWYDNVSANIDSWEDFENSFKSRFDNHSTQRDRNRLLHTRRQSDKDPSEKFIYEMYTLGKQIDPLESDEENLKRIRDALHRDIGALIGDLQPWSIDNLIERVSNVHSLLNRQSRLKSGKAANIPPFKSNPENKQGNNRGNNYSSNFNNRGISNRGRGNYQNSYGNRNFENRNFNSYGYNQNQNNNRGDRNGSDFRFRGQIRGNFNSRGDYQQRGSNNNPRGNFQQNYNQNREARGNYSNDRGQFRDVTQVKCRRCFNFGHYAKDCNQGGVVLALPEYPQQGTQHDTNTRYTHQSQNQNFQNSNQAFHSQNQNYFSQPQHNLNYVGRSHAGSNHDYQQR